MHPNECYNSSSKQFGSSKKEATMFKLAPSNKCVEGEECTIGSTQNKQPQDNHSSTFQYQCSRNPAGDTTGM